MKQIKPSSKSTFSKMMYANAIITLKSDKIVFAMYLDREHMQKKHLKPYREYCKHKNWDVACHLASDILYQRFWHTRKFRVRLMTRREARAMNVSLNATGHSAPMYVDRLLTRK